MLRQGQESQKKKKKNGEGKRNHIILTTEKYFFNLVADFREKETMAFERTQIYISIYIIIGKAEKKIQLNFKFEFN